MFYASIGKAIIMISFSNGKVYVETLYKIMPIKI